MHKKNTNVSKTKVLVPPKSPKVASAKPKVNLSKEKILAVKGLI